MGQIAASLAKKLEGCGQRGEARTSLEKAPKG